MRSLPIVGYGVNGDPLRQGKLDLPELLETPTPDEFDWARKFIARRRWREAITYRKTAPHEYTVREWKVQGLANQDFDQFTVFVRWFGYADFFYRVRHIYWVIDEFKYWTMGWPVAETTVINRARVDAPQPWKATSGIAMETLLGHLSQFASFSTQGEVLCTQGLAYLLREYPDAQAAFAAKIADVTGVMIGENLNWRAEVRQERDGGRPDLEAYTTAANPLRNGSDDGQQPDLEACTTGNVPKLKIEAKLGAALDPGQLKSYAKDLQSRSCESAFLVLVPCRRTKEATNMVTEVFELSGPSPWPNVAIAVVSWEAVLDAFGRVACGRFRGELEQFEAMYRVLSGGYIQPLAGPEELTEWRKRETDFVNLVNQVTRRLTTHHNVLPIGVEPLEQAPEELEPKGYRRRYVCQAPGEPESCFSIGVRDPFAGNVSPIWLRFNKTTGHFCDIRDRLEASYLEPRLVWSGGHIWMPLDLPLGSDGVEMVNALVVQAEEIARVAYEPKT